MVGQIDNGRSIGFGIIGGLQFAVVVPIIAHFDSHLAGIFIITIRADQRKDHPIGLHAAGPDLVGEAFQPAMQMLSSRVLSQAVLLAVERETSFTDTVGKTARGLTHIRAIPKVAFKTVVSERHIGQFTFTIRHIDFHNAGANVAQHH